MSKSQTNPKPEQAMTETKRLICLGFWDSDLFRISDFDIRISRAAGVT
jgi:hypothetical protein